MQFDGGNPLELTGNITLCSRDNLTENRFYSGSLSHLSLFDVALTTQQVLDLYRAVPVAAGTSPAPDPALGSSSWLDQYNASAFLQVREGSVYGRPVQTSRDVEVCLDQIGVVELSGVSRAETGLKLAERIPCYCQVWLTLPCAAVHGQPRGSLPHKCQ